MKAFRRWSMLLAAGLAASACSSTPTRPTSDDKKSVVFAQPLAKAQKAAMDSLVVLGFELKKTEPQYIEGTRPRKMGLFVGSGGETVGVWLDPVGESATQVQVDTARTFVGAAGQKKWDDDVLAEMQKALGKPRPM
jgi:hypothetical protein